METLIQIAAKLVRLDLLSEIEKPRINKRMLRRVMYKIDDDLKLIALQLRDNDRAHVKAIEALQERLNK